MPFYWSSLAKASGCELFQTPLLPPHCPSRRQWNIKKASVPQIVIDPAFTIGAWGDRALWPDDVWGLRFLSLHLAQRPCRLIQGLGKPGWASRRNETRPVPVLHKGALTAVQQQSGWRGSTWRLQRAPLLLKSIISASVTLRRPNGWKSITHWFLLYRTKDI